MSRITLNRISSLINAPTTLNGILTQIESAFDRVLFRDATTPNQMSGVLDMNSNRITNLPAPGHINDPVRLQDVVPSINGINISENLLNTLFTLTSTTTSIAYNASGYATITGSPPNQVVNFFVPTPGPFGTGAVGTGVNATANGYSSTNQALWLVGNYTQTGGAPYGLVSITDTGTGSGVAFRPGLWVAHNIGASAGEGSRVALQPILRIDNPLTDVSNRGLYYISAFPQTYVTKNLGGASGAGNSRGDVYGGGSLAQLESGATYVHSLTGHENNISAQTGSSLDYKTIQTIIAVNSDAVGGGIFNAMTVYLQDSSCTYKWPLGISFGSPLGLWPFSSSSTIIGSTAPATGSRVANWFIDGTNITYSGGFAKFPGGQIDASGNLTINKITSAGPISTPVPLSSVDTTYTVGATDTDITFNTSGAVTVTLPSPASNPGRELWIKTLANQAINSASSNVQPKAGGALGTTILAGVAGNWCRLVSDGNTAWIIMAGS